MDTILGILAIGILAIYLYTTQKKKFLGVKTDELVQKELQLSQKEISIQKDIETLKIVPKSPETLTPDQVEDFWSKK